MTEPEWYRVVDHEGLVGLAGCVYMNRIVHRSTLPLRSHGLEPVSEDEAVVLGLEGKLDE